MSAQAKLTVAQGLAIQAQQLADWKLLLTPEAYALLEQGVRAINSKSNYLDGYDVFRGTAIDMLVHNEVLAALRSGV